MEYLDERDLNVYIDGSSLPSPRRGGVGIVFISEGPDGHWLQTPYEIAGIVGATNNQMELQACIDALQVLARGRAPVDLTGRRKVIFWTDSSYLVRGYDSARFEWPRTRWLTRDGNPVANTALWKQLLRLTRSRRAAGRVSLGQGSQGQLLQQASRQAGKGEREISRAAPAAGRPEGPAQEDRREGSARQRRDARTADHPSGCSRSSPSPPRAWCASSTKS